MITGDTKILTVYDGAVPVSELYQNPFSQMVYSWNPETKLPAIGLITNILQIIVENTDVYRIDFDSGLNVYFSDDQKFYTFRGDGIDIKDLKISESVRAFSASIHRDGHLRVHGWFDGKAKHQYVARMIWEYWHGPIPKGMILHHINFDELDNRLSNFELLSVKEHNQVHYPYRRQKGFYKRNHKIINISTTREVPKAEFYLVEVNKFNTFIIPDEIPVSGNMSGIVCAG